MSEAQPLTTVIITPLLLALDCRLQAIKSVIERYWWSRISDPVTVRSLLQLVYARPSMIDDSLLERIIEATRRPEALDAFTSIMLAPQTQLSFNEMLDAIRCPVCMAYGERAVCGVCMHTHLWMVLL